MWLIPSLHVLLQQVNELLLLQFSSLFDLFLQNKSTAYYMDIAESFRNLARKKHPSLDKGKFGTKQNQQICNKE